MPRGALRGGEQRGPRRGEGEAGMTNRKLEVLAAFAVAGILLSSAPQSQAAMGLRCSDWLNPRAHARYDPRTQKFVPVNPPGAPPVSDDVDNKSAWLNNYAGGMAETYWRLDGWLAKFAENSGATAAPARATPVAILDRVEQLCRGSLQQERRDADALDVLSLHNEALMLMRMMYLLEIMKRRGLQ
jgi:hypothetical protein